MPDMGVKGEREVLKGRLRLPGNCKVYRAVRQTLPGRLGQGMTTTRSRRTSATKATRE